jgi:hypothetical protein
VAADTPVFVIATNATSGDPGTGFISLEYYPRVEFPLMLWSGVNSPRGAAGPPTSTGGFSPGNGTTMLTFDFYGDLTLQVTDGNHFVVHNAAASTQTGVIWILTAPVTAPV